MMEALIVMKSNLQMYLVYGITFCDVVRTFSYPHITETSSWPPKSFMV